MSNDTELNTLQYSTGNTKFFLNHRSQARIVEICDAIPRGEDGLPIIVGGSDTYYSVIKKFIGKIQINFIEHNVKITKANWSIKEYRDKRRIPDHVKDVMNKLHNDFIKAYDEERLLRKTLSRKRKRIIDKQYFQDNKAQIMLQRKESKRQLAASNEVAVNEIYKMIVEGKTKSEIQRTIISKYSYTERRANQLISATQNKIKEIVLEERLILKEKHHTQLMDLYEKNLELGDYKECRNILETLNKMYALNEPVTNKLEVNAKIVHFSFTEGEFTKDDANAAIPVNIEVKELDETSSENYVDNSDYTFNDEGELIRKSNNNMEGEDFPPEEFNEQE